MNLIVNSQRARKVKQDQQTKESEREGEKKKACINLLKKEMILKKILKEKKGNLSENF